MMCTLLYINCCLTIEGNLYVRYNDMLKLLGFLRSNLFFIDILYSDGNIFTKFKKQEFFKVFITEKVSLKLSK